MQRQTAHRAAVVALVAAYAIVIVAAAFFARPVTIAWLIGIAAVPAIVGFLFGIPKVVRAKPKGIMIVFHLIVYPLFAAIALGLPAAFVASQLSEFFAG